MGMKHLRQPSLLNFNLFVVTRILGERVTFFSRFIWLYPCYLECRTHDFARYFAAAQYLHDFLILLMGPECLGYTYNELRASAAKQFATRATDRLWDRSDVAIIDRTIITVVMILILAFSKNVLKKLIYRRKKTTNERRIHVENKKMEKEKEVEQHRQKTIKKDGQPTTVLKKNRNTIEG